MIYQWSMSKLTEPNVNYTVPDILKELILRWDVCTCAYVFLYIYMCMLENMNYIAYM